MRPAVPTSEPKRRAPVPEANVLGVRVSAVDLPGAVRLIRGAVETGTRGYVCVRDVHGVIACQNDARLKAVHNASFLTVADGMPLVWALRRAGHDIRGRVYGPDLMLAALQDGIAAGTRHFLYGATPDVLARLELALGDRFPGVVICGRHAPPFRPLTPGEREGVADMINTSGADIVWVGLGTPKQELWMGEMRDHLEAPMLIGVGAAFDFHAGLKPQAPSWMQARGLEWSFRLATEPRRLWRRYARTVPSYLFLSALQRTGLRTFTTAPAGDGMDLGPGAIE